MSYISFYLEVLSKNPINANQSTYTLETNFNDLNKGVIKANFF